MAKKRGAPENLDPVRTKEEARARGRNGGIKSGEVRRKQRDAKNAINLLLNMAAKNNLDKNLKELGLDECDRTNMMALQARLFTMAMSGDLKAYNTLMKYAGQDPEENRRERESVASDRRRDKETEARVTAIERGDSMGRYAEEEGVTDEEELEDVIIVMPENGREKPPDSLPSEQEEAAVAEAKPEGAGEECVSVSSEGVKPAETIIATTSDGSNSGPEEEAALNG